MDASCDDICPPDPENNALCGGMVLWALLTFIFGAFLLCAACMGGLVVLKHRNMRKALEAASKPQKPASAADAAVGADAEAAEERLIN